jgi:hypothetical protein
MSVIHISAAEAARDFASILARVREGDEFIIEDDREDDWAASVLLRAVEPPKGRLLSEVIALAEAHAKELGYEPVMDADFAADLEERIRDRKPRDTSTWD